MDQRSEVRNTGRRETVLITILNPKQVQCKCRTSAMRVKSLQSLIHILYHKQAQCSPTQVQRKHKTSAEVLTFCWYRMRRNFRELNFQGVKFLVVEATHEILPPWQFAQWKDGCWVQKKVMCAWIPCLQQHMENCCWRNAVLLERAKEHSLTNMQWRVVIINSWWQNFCGFNFRGWWDPRKFQHNENFCVYGTT